MSKTNLKKQLSEKSITLNLLKTEQYLAGNHEKDRKGDKGSYLRDKKPPLMKNSDHYNKSFKSNVSNCIQGGMQSSTHGDVDQGKERFGNELKYELSWQIGVNPNCRIQTICNDNQNDICFVSHEMIIVLNMTTGKYTILNGHSEKILCLQYNEYLISASKSEIIVWDTHLAAPILILSPGQTRLLSAILSSSFHFIFGISSTQLLVWNIYFLKVNNRNTQKNYAYDLKQPIETRIIQCIVDSECDGYLCVIAERSVHFYSIEEKKNGDQDMKEYMPEMKWKYTNTCGGYLPGTTNLLVGTREGYITLWCGSKLLRRARVHIGASNDKKFVRAFKIPRSIEYMSDQISVTALQCTPRLVIIGDSHGQVTLLNHDLTLLYWVSVEPVKEIRGLSVCCGSTMINNSNFMFGNEAGSEEELGSSFGYKMEGGGDSEETNVKRDSLKGLTDEMYKTTDVEEAAESQSKRSEDNMLKIKMNMFLEDKPTDTSLEGTRLHVDDVIIMGHQGEVWLMNFDTGTALLIIKPPLYHITSLSTHPSDSLAYVISDRNNISVIDYNKQQMILTKSVETTQVLNPIPRQPTIEKVCRKQFTPTDQTGMINNQDVTYVLSMYKFGVTLLLCGFKNGMLWVLDQYLTIQHSPKYTPVSNKVTGILSNDVNTLIAVSYYNGMISIYDIRSPIRLQVVAVYKAHEQVTQMIFDNVTETDVTIASIGTHRLLHVRTIRRKCTGNTVHNEKKSNTGNTVRNDKSENNAVHETQDNNEKLGNIVPDDAEENSCDDNCVTSGNSVNSDEQQINSEYEFGNVAIRRVEQFGKLLFIVNFPSEYFVKDNLEANPETIPESSLYLIGTDQYKYRFILKSNLTCIKTIQGPILRSPVVNFNILPYLNSVLITSVTEIGIQKLPLSGLPHDYIYFTLPLSTKEIFFTPDRDHLISIGGKENGGKENDFLSVWKIDQNKIRTHNPLFKHQLEPYYELVQGGYRGDEFNKIENTFVYFTIQGVCHNFVNKQTCLLHSSMLPSCSTIDLCHLPFILSGLGFFPSEFDLRLLNTEINLMGLTELDFSHFLVLYLNHRPAKAVSYEEVLTAVKYFARDDSIKMFKTAKMLSKHEDSSESFSKRKFINNDKRGETSKICSCSVSGSSNISGPSTKNTGPTSPSTKNMGPTELNSRSGPNSYCRCKRSSKNNSKESVSSSELNSDRSRLSRVSNISGLTSSSNSSINIDKLLRTRSSSNEAETWISKETIMKLLMNYGEIKHSKELSKQLVDFLFSGDDILDVMEMTARLIEPEIVIKLDEIDQIRVYQC